MHERGKQMFKKFFEYRLLLGVYFRANDRLRENCFLSGKIKQRLVMSKKEMYYFNDF